MRASVPAALLLAASALQLLTAGSAFEPVTHGPCPDAQEPSLFLQWDAQLENLAFDGNGGLFVSDLGADRVLGVGPDGQASVVLATDGIHGMTVGPDGLLYIGAQAPGSAGDPGDWEVWRATDASATSYTTYTSGLPAANGMAFDADGHLFVSNPLGTAAPYLVRVPADDPSHWTPWDDRYGPNGLWFDADRATLYAAITGDQSSPIVTVDTKSQKMTVVTTLSAGALTLQPGLHPPEGLDQPVVPKGLDDITADSDGLLYVAAHVTGEVLRVDPAEGTACVLANGFEEPTSLRFAVGFGPYGGDLFVTDMGGVGATALAGPGAGAVWRIPMA